MRIESPIEHSHRFMSKLPQDLNCSNIYNCNYVIISSTTRTSWHFNDESRCSNHFNDYKITYLRSNPWPQNILAAGYILLSLSFSIFISSSSLLSLSHSIISLPHEDECREPDEAPLWRRPDRQKIRCRRQVWLNPLKSFAQGWCPYNTRGHVSPSFRDQCGTCTCDQII